MQELTLRRPDGRIVDFDCLAASAGGRSLRGRSIVCGIMSESAFFYGKDYVVSDVEIYRAMAPRFRPQFGLGLRGMGSWNENQFGSFSQGGIGGELLFRVHPRLNLELAAQYQRSSDQTEAYLGYARWDAPLTLGLRIHLGNAYWPISPYLVVAGGMDRAQATVLATDGLVYDRSWMFEGQGGGGVELRLGRHLAMNFDIRGVGRVRADGQRSLQVFDANNIGYDILGNQFSLQFNFGLAAYF